MQTVALEDILKSLSNKHAQNISKSGSNFPVTTLGPCNRDDICPVVISVSPKDYAIIMPRNMWNTSVEQKFRLGT